VAEERKRCSWVHDTLFIGPRGDVFGCPHFKPGPIGNIYDAPLRDIYNSERAREYRQQEIESNLKCLGRCTLPQKEIKYDDVWRDYDSQVKRLHIEFGEKCNIACIMCNQDHKSRLELDENVLVTNVDIPRSDPAILLQGGEPLVIQSAKRFFDHCAENGAKVTFLTNGTAISEEMAEKIALHARSITFSLNAATKETHEIVNAGSKFDKVIRNIGRVTGAKRRLRGGVHINGHMTIVPENLDELPMFIEMREEFGFESINFGYDRSVPVLLAADPDRKARLACEVARAGAKCGWRRTDPTRLRQLFGDSITRPLPQEGAVPIGLG
jgi:radical SAM protein with 4Fe4S-binding SPASM domain